ncbi:MAG: hypothetical protein ABI181_07085 [Mycobacteriaceae bacterium]
MTEPAPPAARSRGHAASAARITASQLSLAAASYAVLAVAGNALDARAFAAVTSFYLLLNTAGRGICSAVELHLTRAVAADVATGRPASAALRASRVQVLLLVVLAVALTLGSEPLLRTVFAGDSTLTVLLAAAVPGLAVAYAVRGRLAGERRYSPYAASFVVEALTTVVVGVVLLVVGAHDPRWWALAFITGPTVAAVVLVVTVRDARSAAPGDAAPRARPSAASGGSLLAWSVLVLGGSQAVWNLSPVILTGRLSDAPGLAAAFASLALVLRVPVLVFPAAQAVLLPVLTAGSTGASGGLRLHGALRNVLRTPWPWAAAGALGAWLLAAVFLAPPLVSIVFGSERLTGILGPLLLASATVIGGVATLAQTALVARGAYRAAGVGWAVAAGVLVVVSRTATASVTVAAAALAVAVLVALGCFAVALRASTTVSVPREVNR